MGVFLEEFSLSLEIRAVTKDAYFNAVPSDRSDCAYE